MKRLSLVFLLLSMSMAPAGAAAPKAKPAPPALELPKGDAAAGLHKSDSERCQECHGSAGQGIGGGNGSEGKFAKLAGQYPAYLIKQIRNFRSGERKDDIMSMMANSISDADLVDIVAYFSSQAPMRGEGAGSAAGQQLFRHGDPTRAIPACAGCHGAEGEGGAGAGAVFPRIKGQEWRYLEKQLLDWRSGERRNSAGAVMNTIARQLSDADIQALASYLSAL